MDHNTIVKVNDYRNLVVKLDATQKAFDGRLVGDFGVYGYSSKIHDIFDTRMLFYSAAAQNPTYPAGTDVNGNWVKNSAASHINHPGALLYEKNDSEERNFNTHLGLKFNILDNLILSAFGSYSYSSTEMLNFVLHGCGRKAMFIVESSRVKTTLQMCPSHITMLGRLTP